MREHSKQHDGAERQQRARRDAKPARWNHLMDEADGCQTGEEAERGKDERALQQIHFCNPKEARARCTGQGNSRADKNEAHGHQPHGRQWSHGAQGRLDRVADALEHKRIDILWSLRRLFQDVVNRLVLSRESSAPQLSGARGANRFP